MDPSENYIRKKIIRLQRFFQEKFLSFIIFENQEFIFSVSEIQKHFSKPPLFEYFYRWARKKTGILMENTSPV
jgi:deoxyribodipyrimidine photolyase-like uncharacterized protein